MTRPRPVNEFRAAWRAFVLELARALRMDRLVAWLAAALERRRGRRA